MVVLDPLVLRVSFQSYEAGDVDEVLAGEPKGLQDEDVVCWLGKVIGGLLLAHLLDEVVADKSEVVLGGLVRADGQSVAPHHALQNLLRLLVRDEQVRVIHLGNVVGSLEATVVDFLVLVVFAMVVLL